MSDHGQTTLDPERTRLKFSPTQFWTIIVTVALCTWRVNDTLTSLRADIRAANDKASACWSVDDQNRWVWFVNRSGKITLPYPIELRNSTTSPPP